MRISNNNKIWPSQKLIKNTFFHIEIEAKKSSTVT